MIEIYYWEDDPEAEMVLRALKKSGLEYRETLLDAEMPSARPSISYQGKTYWEWDEFLKVFRANH